MIHNYETKHLRILKNGPHQFIVLNTLAVISHSNNTSLVETPNRSQLLTLHTLCDTPGGKDVHDGIPRNRIFDLFNGPGPIAYRHCIRHADNGGKSSRRRGA